jgi:hypothetical protein
MSRVLVLVCACRHRRSGHLSDRYDSRLALDEAARRGRSCSAGSQHAGRTPPGKPGFSTEKGRSSARHGLSARGRWGDGPACLDRFPEE